MACWQSEYDWNVSRRSDSKSIETVLSVLFDSGAQRQFSSVRITLLNVAPTRWHRTWRITPRPSSLSVVSHVSAQDRSVTQNDPSLPICHIVFMADRHSARSQTTDRIAKRCGELVLSEPESATPTSVKVFDFSHPLTENTQSVSFSFTSSYLFFTMKTHGVFSDPSFRQPATVGRVVRVVPTSKRRTIPLPTDVLLLIFENLHSPVTYRSWRQDLLNSALVCREWTCALDVLVIDFRSRESCQRHFHPPEIISFANGLVARPSLGLGIGYLSLSYFEGHPIWNPFPDHPPGMSESMFLAKTQSLKSDLYRSPFTKAFLSILRVAKNVQYLSLTPGIPLVISVDDLTDALAGLNTLDTFRCTLEFTIAQLLHCIATCSSLKDLSIFCVLPPTTHIVPFHSPSFHLTSLMFAHVPVQDDELACLANASSATLQRLTLNAISHLTNAGLSTALTAVCTSLTYLCIMIDSEPARVQGEEHALDVIIVRMERLTELKIVRSVASEQMVMRRAEAFARRTATALLPKVHLHLVISRGETEDRDGLMGAVYRDWPGWKMTRC